MEENAEQSVHNSHQIIGSQVLSTRKPELEALNDPLKVIVNVSVRMMFKSALFRIQLQLLKIIFSFVFVTIVELI